jgi:hypothetical protein
MCKLPLCANATPHHSGQRSRYAMRYAQPGSGFESRKSRRNGPWLLSSLWALQTVVAACAWVACCARWCDGVYNCRVEASTARGRERGRERGRSILALLLLLLSLLALLLTLLVIRLSLLPFLFLLLFEEIISILRFVAAQDAFDIVLGVVGNVLVG